VRLLGLPDRFLPHASRASLLRQADLDPEGIARGVLEWMGRRPERLDHDLGVVAER
jgi:deoxyxylulose-5-phosphate synthase